VLGEMARAQRPNGRFGILRRFAEAASHRRGTRCIAVFGQAASGCTPNCSTAGYCRFPTQLCVALLRNAPGTGLTWGRLLRRLQMKFRQPSCAFVALGEGGPKSAHYAERSDDVLGEMARAQRPCGRFGILRRFAEAASHRRGTRCIAVFGQAASGCTPNCSTAGYCRFLTQLCVTLLRNPPGTGLTWGRLRGVSAGGCT
jgi:hypothetical protein